MIHVKVNHDGEEHITVIIPGQTPLVAHESHPNFEKIVAKAEANDEDGLADLFDVSNVVAERFDRLSERVTVANGRVYFDGDEIESSLTRQIVRFINEGENDWVPLVKFFENVQANPTEHSREQLFDWLDAREFTITYDGNIVGYKGVQKDGDGNLVSGFTGRATVNGQVHNGHIPNPLGAVVEMPRSEVAHDPGAACSTGLHVGTYSYAKGYAGGALLEVHVNPRDVVSVPTDAGGEKVRVSRYKVIRHIDAEYARPLVGGYEDDGDYDCAYCCGETDDGECRC